MSLIVDASVAIKWFSQEQGSPQAEALLEGSEQLLSPDFVLAEIASGLVKKVRLQQGCGRADVIGRQPR